MVFHLADEETIVKIRAAANCKRTISRHRGSIGARASARFNNEIAADSRHNKLGRYSALEAA
jgi:hypothetical protein